ncbi:MAG: insulinase family protein [Dehalococcoidia bacterium]|nr:insulinase family protein [Dehalococcoidia bacterium]
MERRPMEQPITPTVQTLDNGLRLVVTPVPYARSVAVSVYLAAGSRYEPQPSDAGLAHFLEHLCFKGTERRPKPMDISVEIDSIGGSINAATNRELTVYYAKVTPEHQDQTVEVLTDMLRHSLLLPPEIERERGVILEELAAVEDSPAEQASVALDELLWPDQPHGRDIAGTPESVEAMPPERIVDYYRRQYVANATVVSIAGAVDLDSARALVERTTGTWEPGHPCGWVPDRAEVRGARSRLIAKETEQAHLSVGLRGISARDPDRYALDLLSIILGEGMSSRLFSRLREELGLCYDIHTYLTHLLDTGMFGLYAGVDPDNAEEALHEIAAELRRARQPVTPAELERAKAVARSRVQLRMDDTRAVSALYGSQVVLGLPLITPEETLLRSAAVTLEDVERVAHRVLRDEDLHLAVVGPFDDAAALESPLQLDA